MSLYGKVLYQKPTYRRLSDKTDKPNPSDTSIYVKSSYLSFAISTDKESIDFCGNGSTTSKESPMKSTEDRATVARAGPAGRHHECKYVARNHVQLLP